MLVKQDFGNFGSLLKDSLKEQDSLEGKIVKGVIVAIDHDAIVVHVSSKSEGRIPLKEFSDEERSKMKVGDTVDVYIENYESRSGGVILSYQKAIQEVTWLRLIQAFEEKKPVKGIVLSPVKGGLSVDLGGSIAFLPGSQIDIRPFRDASELIGTEQLFLIVKIDEGRGNIVVSRRAVLEEERAADKERLLSELEQGMVVEGVVKNLAPYGAFIDLGGIDGLLHVTDASYKRQEISEILKIGEKIKVMIIRFNRETKRISLGLRQLEKDPWQTVHEQFSVGDRVKGTVTNVTDYGAFVELSEGVEGLIYVREMVWHKKDVMPKDVVVPGQEVEVMILEIDTKKRRISLGLKQCSENLFEVFAKKYPAGSVVEGEIKEVTEFGLLVALPDGMEGVVHKLDLSWTGSAEDALGRYRTDQKSRISLKVNKILPEKEFIGLSVKHLTDDPLADKFDKMEKGQTVKGRILKILDNGVEVDIGDDLRAIIRRSDLSRDPSRQDPSRFQVGEVVDAKITNVNKQKHHVSLSIKAYDLEEEKRILAEYSGSSGEVSDLGAALNQAFKKRDAEAE